MSGNCTFPWVECWRRRWREWSSSESDRRNRGRRYMKRFGFYQCTRSRGNKDGKVVTFRLVVAVHLWSSPLLVWIDHGHGAEDKGVPLQENFRGEVSPLVIIISFSHIATVETTYICNEQLCSPHCPVFVHVLYIKEISVYLKKTSSQTTVSVAFFIF